MSHLAFQLEEYFRRYPNRTIADIESAAGVKRGAIDSIRRHQHPRPDRMGALLNAVDDDTARRWLIAYLRDDCPPEYLPRLDVHVQPGTSTVTEPAAAYVTGNDVDGAWTRLHTAILADPALGKWFLKTVSLILGE